MYKIKFSQSEQELALSMKDGEIMIDNKPFEWDLSKTDQNSFHIIHNHQSFTVHLIEVNHEEKTFKLQLNGKIIEMALKDKMDLLLEEMGISDMNNQQALDIKAPMPGLIIDIMIKEGDEVKKGDPLLILEAMKMENVIKSPGDGIISSVKAGKGDSVEKNQLLIQF